MDLQLRSKTALVLAASKGIGKGAAIALAREGCKVTIASSNPENLAAAQADIRGICGVTVATQRMDLSSEASVAQACGEVLKANGHIDILFANGPGPKPTEAASVDSEAFRQALQINLLSTVQICGQLLPAMIQNKFGRIINLSSSVAAEPDEGMVLSAATRAGLLAYCKTLSREVGRHGVTVNSLLTGSVLTDRASSLMAMEAAAAKVSVDAYVSEAGKTIPAGYISTPEQFSHVVAFLASPLSMYITGTSIPVDGGYMRAI